MAFFYLLLLFFAGLLLSNGLSLLCLTHWAPTQGLMLCLQATSAVLTFVVPAAIIYRRLAVQSSVNHPNITHSTCSAAHGLSALYSLLSWAALTPFINLTDKINHDMLRSFPMLFALQEKMEAAMQHLTQFHSLGSFLAVAFVAAFVAAVSEEIFFRGAMQRALLGFLSPAAAIALTATLFSLLHFEPLSFLPRLALGALFGVIAYKTQSLLPTIVLHLLNNLVALLGMHYQWHILEQLGTGHTWYLAIAGAALSVWALSKVRASDCIGDMKAK